LKYLITPALFVLSLRSISMQLHWHAVNVNFFFLRKFMNERSKIILYSTINLEEMWIKGTRIISTSNIRLNFYVNIQSSLFGVGLSCSNIGWCVALVAGVILVGEVLTVLNQFNVITSE